MKTALIIVSVAGALALGAAIFFGVKFAKQNKMLKDPKQIWDKYVATLPVYASNADALEAGLKAGDMYKTPAGVPQTVTA